MAQGFKPAKAAPSKGKGKARSHGPKAAGPKRGPKVIAPKKRQAVQDAAQKQKQQASLTKRIEGEMAGRASSGGPLTIMKKVADNVNQEKEKEKQRKEAKRIEKGRA